MHKNYQTHCIQCHLYEAIKSTRALALSLSSAIVHSSTIRTAFCHHYGCNGRHCCRRGVHIRSGCLLFALAAMCLIRIGLQRSLSFAHMRPYSIMFGAVIIMVVLPPSLLSSLFVVGGVYACGVCAQTACFTKCRVSTIQVISRTAAFFRFILIILIRRVAEHDEYFASQNTKCETSTFFASEQIVLFF